MVVLERGYVFKPAFYLCLAVVLLIQGCAGLSPAARMANADELAKKSDWQKSVIQTTSFPLQVYVKSTQPVPVLIVYIEGDGLAWVSRSKPSSDPTPIDPLGLKLALQDPREGVVYLARPCQYVTSSWCEQKYWTSDRFSLEVVSAMNQAISQLVEKTQAKEVVLIGYSGGGAIAALIAARRKDVRRLITVAGNLDHEAWTNLHHISRLTGSLNAADHWQSLINIPQIHFVGAKDTVIPPAIAESYQNRFPIGNKPEVNIIPDFDHHCCWVEAWPSLLNIP